MFALGFSIALAIALGVIYFLTRKFPAIARPYVWLALTAFTISFPFWHFAYPSYREYVALCARSDLYVVKKTAEVNYPYFDGGSFGAYRMLGARGFKGFDIKKDQMGYVRYSRNDNWASSVCEHDCGNPSVFIWEKTCEVSCLNKTPIPAPEFELRSNYSTSELVRERLVEQRSAVLAPSGEELAVNLSYLYYPYGTGAARILGIASGDSPNLSCHSEKSIWSLEFILPSVSK
jgi:hypothetical protein